VLSPEHSARLRDLRTRAVPVFALVLAGELVFALPFHLVRYFRPTMLEVLGLDNRQLGDVFALYGLLAMASYFPGGLLADRFRARHLLPVALLATAAGGAVLVARPGPVALAVLYAFWGLTTILLFWAGMLKETRRYGGPMHQGTAYGLLDGGRGLVAAAFATAAVVLFEARMPSDPALVTHADRVAAMSRCILFYSASTALAAVIVFFALAADPAGAPAPRPPPPPRTVLSRRTLWWQGLVVVCAYSGYKGLDFYTLYLVEALDFDEVRAARLQAATAYLRPVGAIAAGLLADRLRPSLVLSGTFALAAGAYLVLAGATAFLPLAPLVLGALVVSFLAVFALRGIYFALVAESGIALNATGTAVGVVSVLGFLPDVFFAPLAGRLVDLGAGSGAYTAFFALLAGTMLAGAVATHRVVATAASNAS